MRLVLAGIRGIFSRPFYRYDIVEQLDTIGVGSLTVVLLTGLFTGMALTAQSGLTLDQFGARAVVGRLVGASMIKELGPVLTALMLTGRIGSGIAAELGSMMVTDQINALRALGTDPIRKLVVPRILAGILMTPVLTVDLRLRRHRRAGGSWRGFSCRCTAASTGRRCRDGLYMQDVYGMGLIKPFVLGFIIVTVACHVGMRTSGGTAGVGRSTTDGGGGRVGAGASRRTSS
ncbi:MAG: ABC transporter permease [Vicinamibacterales bacterium]